MKFLHAVVFFFAEPVQSFVLRRPTTAISDFSALCMAKEEPDLFEYFDPLLSPHAYPNGISPDEEPQEPEPNNRIQVESPPPRRKDFGFRTPGSEGAAKQAVAQTPPPLDVVAAAEDRSERKVVDPAFTFDPTISPHAYVHGTPDVVVGDEATVYSSGSDDQSLRSHSVGILLMDHGSRNKASNDRLHIIAEAYQESLAKRKDGTRVIVRAAHMEIANPSIPEGIRTLVEEDGVNEIVCHPFFLSPAGRHAKEDIPKILEETVEDMKLEIPIATTEPTGANVDAMIGVIHSMVQQTATIQINRK